MNKKIFEAKKIERKTERLGLVTSKMKDKHRSYRCNANDSANLQQIRKEVNDLSNTRITDTVIIKALIYLGVSMDKEELLAACKEVL